MKQKRHKKIKNIPHAYFPFATGEIGEKLQALKLRLLGEGK